MRAISDETNALIKKCLMQNEIIRYSKYLNGVVEDTRNHPEPFLAPLRGVLSLIAGQGQTFTGCGDADQAVSEHVKERLFNIFETTGLFSSEFLQWLRGTYDVRVEIRSFLVRNPAVDVLVIAGSHVGLAPRLPYDPHRGALVVNPDPERSADIIAPIATVLGHLPDNQFKPVIDDSNFGGTLLKDTGVAPDLFRVLQSCGVIEEGAERAYAALISAGFVGRFEECLDPGIAGLWIEEVGADYIHKLDLNGLRQFLGEGFYSRLMKEIVWTDEVFVVNLFSNEDTIPLLTQEAQHSYFTAYRSVCKDISDKAALLRNVEDGSVYEAGSVLQVNDGRIYLLKDFIKP
ncbi:MAG: hypothetical protein I8H80_02305 [Alphaproteobacteria bacterium]|nr:hypothetical protein [Alphaproteobacteria bacterium]